MSRDLTPSELYAAVTQSPENISGMRFEADALERFHAATLDFAGCDFINVSFNACEIDRIYFMDCRFEKCDISGVLYKTT